MPRQLICPNGHEIDGTYELVPGIAQIDSITRAEDGSVEYEHGGWTEIDWNGQETQMRDGKVLFGCVEGELVTEDQLIDGPDDEED